jgi:hypothetical protein
MVHAERCLLGSCSLSRPHGPQFWSDQSRRIQGLFAILIAGHVVVASTFSVGRRAIIRQSAQPTERRGAQGQVAWMRDLCPYAAPP